MPKRAFLLIADIGGYTRFMRVHRINLSHAQYVIARLLEAVIDGASPGLRLSKLEGDAALFYGELARDEDVAKLASRVGSIRSAFLARQTELMIDRACSCDGCVQAGDLKLKFIAHEGEIAFQKVKRHTELAGVDVILLHRLLKNDVPIAEYVLMTEEVHGRVDGSLKQNAVAIEHDVESFGPTPGFYVDLTTIPAPLAPPRAPSTWRKLVAWLKMTWSSLPYFLGLRKPCDGFRNPPRLAGEGAKCDDRRK